MKKVQVSIDPLVIAISSRALFDLAESHRVYESEGLDAYQRYQIEREDEPLARGVAFELVQKLLHLNDLLEESPVQVILLSRNSADTGLRIFNSIEHYGLNITRAAFCSGDSPYRYISAFNSHLFLSTDGADVRQALELGVAAATILPSNKPPSSPPPPPPSALASGPRIEERTAMRVMSARMLSASALKSNLPPVTKLAMASSALRKALVRALPSPLPQSIASLA